MVKEPTGRKRKKFVALRLSDKTISLLKKMAGRTGKTQTRLIEEALYLHGKEIA